MGFKTRPVVCARICISSVWHLSAHSKTVGSSMWITVSYEYIPPTRRLLRVRGTDAPVLRHLKNFLRKFQQFYICFRLLC
jgi:hypothetical protein